MTLIYVTVLILLAVWLFLKVIANYFNKKSRSSKWIEMYLLLRRHNPLYGYIYALALPIRTIKQLLPTTAKR